MKKITEFINESQIDKYPELFTFDLIDTNEGGDLEELKAVFSELSNLEFQLAELGKKRFELEFDSDVDPKKYDQELKDMQKQYTDTFNKYKNLKKSLQ